MGETEGERETRERKREKSTVKVIWWDGESQSKENKEAHQMRGRRKTEQNKKITYYKE